MSSASPQSCPGLRLTHCPWHHTPGCGALPSSWSPGGCPHLSQGGFHTTTPGRPPQERPGSEWHLWAPLSPRSFPPPSQGILRTGLEEVRQFFALNGSCRLPLSPSLLVKGVVPRVSDWGFGALRAGRAQWRRGLPTLVIEGYEEERHTGASSQCSQVQTFV